MKKLLATGFAAFLLAFAAAPALADDEVNWLALPADKAALQELDTEQTRALRNSVRHCDDIRRSDHSGTPCVFLDLDRAMRQAEDPALRSYHFALPRSMRYDEARNSGAAIERVMHLREKAVEE
ncbi:hypothetical protein [Parvibaculum sp.]|jgi:hypothetical protein|uniref:hypothetical protein n=1 Tax=Parvibaculum sp. TaxID=2024848 RepID=UPI001B2BE0CB|nr:hypothetical protein [Parvibaculum sp.]MBO6635285.1 hypothetical protein [Parvibaculum sp.]MBO6679600.1 hypothetical protein [Parvibaculum sp.]MBO6684891.1 hypothetical protein [Parvibaculum sp.]